MTEQEVYTQIYNKLKYVNNNLYNAISKLDTIYNNLNEAIKINDAPLSISTVSEIKKGLISRRSFISNNIMYEASKKM